MGPYLYFRVLIFTFLASFTQRMSIQSACIQQWFRFKLLANFDFYLCLRINFHTSSFWVLILAARGPYWVLISQKKWVLIGSFSQSLGVFISFRDSGQFVFRHLLWSAPLHPLCLLSTSAPHIQCHGC